MLTKVDLPDGIKSDYISISNKKDVPLKCICCEE